jgi:hypothetical protein
VEERERQTGMGLVHWLVAQPGLAGTPSVSVMSSHQSVWMGKGLDLLSSDKENMKKVVRWMKETNI